VSFTLAGLDGCFLQGPQDLSSSFFTIGWSHSLQKPSSSIRKKKSRIFGLSLVVVCRRNSHLRGPLGGCIHRFLVVFVRSLLLSPSVERGTQSNVTIQLVRSGRSRSTGGDFFVFFFFFFVLIIVYCLRVQTRMQR